MQSSEPRACPFALILFQEIHHQIQLASHNCSAFVLQISCRSFFILQCSFLLLKCACFSQWPCRLRPACIARTIFQNTVLVEIETGLGTKNLARYIQAMRPEEFLVDNLNDPNYLQIGCGGLENLASSFARNWQAGEAIRSNRMEKTINHPIPLKKKCLREEGSLAKLKRAFKIPGKEAAA
jgi:hypothetical protein